MKGGATISITIHDIAKRVGVSPQTVSRVMNNHPGVSATTRKAVLAAVDELGFRPNAAARLLRKGKSSIIGVLVPDLCNPHYAEYASCLQRIAHTMGYMLVVSNTNYDASLSLAHLRTLVDHRADAVIWLAGFLDPTLITFIRERRIPTVIIDTIPPEGIDHVRCLLSHPARDQATYNVITELIQLGHRRLVYITEGTTQLSEYSRVQAFRKAIQDQCLPASAAVVKSRKLSHLSSAEDGYQAMNEVLNTNFRPTAVCTLTDLLAIGVMRAVHEHGLRVPQDISIVGCDDIMPTAFIDPPLTTIRTPYEAISRTMLRIAQQLIEPETVPEDDEEIPIEYTLVRRASMGPPPPETNESEGLSAK